MVRHLMVMGGLVLGIDGALTPRAVMTVGAAAAAVFATAPATGPVQTFAWFVPLMLAVALLGRRLRSSAADVRAPLAVLLAGALGYLLVSVVWYLTPTALKIELPFPSPVDLAYFTVYATYAAFLWMVIRRQRTDDRTDARLAVIDAGIFTAAMSTIAWEAVVEPNLDARASGLVTLAAVAYPAFTVVLFGLAVRLAVSSGTIRSGAGVLLVLWIGAEVVADVSYGHQSAGGEFHFGTPLSLLWITSGTCLAALAVHPGLDDLLTGGREGRSPASAAYSAFSGARGGILGWARFALLYVAALVPVALLAGDADRLAVVLTAAVTFGLVVVRLAVMAGDQREQRRLADELERANAAKSDFLATMSHEIRTPLNAIVGMTGLLIDSPLTASQKEYAETTRTAGESLLSIINDILDFSKIEAGRLDLEAQPFLLLECVESAVDLLAPHAAAKDVQLAYLVDRDCPEAVVGDVTRLRQVLVNLLSNAVKFTDEGEVVLRVTRPGSDDHRLCFSVCDSGPGIPPDRVARLFEPFQQMDSSTTRTHGGTGLGLAISRRLTTAMGGTIRVESEPGQGATFHVTAALPPASAVPARVCLDADEMRGKHVLVVDDNPTNRHIVQYQLHTWHMTSSDTGDPAEALAWVRDGRRFDAAILDMHLPGTDGILLAERLRHEGAADLPLVLLSSLGEPVRRPGASQFSALLTKPIKPSALYDALATAMATPRAGDARAEPERSAAPQRGLRILLAEDNPINQKVAVRVLERLGYRTDVVANGLEAVDAVTRLPYDVVLMDVQMPEMDGLTATQRIRSSPTLARQPLIIAMTANAFAEDRARCLAAGMNDYLSKPVRREDLGAALERAAASIEVG